MLLMRRFLTNGPTGFTGATVVTPGWPPATGADRTDKEVDMGDSRPITPSEQHCISDCIRRFWGDRDEPSDPDARDRAYEQCLTDCQICG